MKNRANRPAASERHGASGKERGTDVRAIAGAIVAASGALLHAATALAASAVRVAEQQTGSKTHFPFGEGGYALAWVLVGGGLAVLFLDFWGARGKGKGE